MSEQIRRWLAIGIISLAPASFFIYESLFSFYFASHPNEPHPELGLIYALGNQGSYVFISDTESTSLFLLRQAFIIAAALFLLVVPKQFELRPSSTPRGKIRAIVEFVGLKYPSTDFYFIFIGGIAVWVALIRAGGAQIVSYLVNHGIILHL